MLSAIVAIILGTSALASCAPAQPNGTASIVTALASATVSPSATAVPQLVYQADWSHGLAGWTATPGWSVSGGALRSDTGSDREVTPSFQPTTPEYAVEFRLQIISVSPNPKDATMYELSADSAAGVDGYIALFDHITLTYSLFPSHPHEVIYIDPMLDQDPGMWEIHDFEPGTRLRTYRVEVRGSQVTLLIDGRVASWAHSAKTAHLAAGPLHFYCTGVALQLSDFKVYAL